MNHKWILNIIELIMTGHKKIFFILVSVMVIFVSGCGLFEWDDYGNTYSARILNSTDDTLLLSVYRGGFSTDNDISEGIILPNHFYPADVFEVDEGDDPIKNHFDNLPYLDTIWVYYLDKKMQELLQYDTILNDIVYPDSSNLLTIWTGPLEHLPDSIHRFNNYNSWEVFKEDKMIQYTIHESDLERWINNQN